MTQTNYSHSYERQLSREEAAVAERLRTVTAADAGTQTGGLAAHPDLWLVPATTALSANVVTGPEQVSQQPNATMTSPAISSVRPEQLHPGVAGNVVEAAGKAEHLAAARRQIEEAM